MANKVLGITVDIEGKTSGLTKSLQDANSAISKTTSALKDVDKALKLDPTNVELLAQKEALLNKQIEQTSTKLDVMKQVAEDANAALERGDITQEQYASLTAEIVKTEQSLNGLENEANQSGDALEDAGDAAEDTGDKAEKAGEQSEKLGKAAAAAGKAAEVAFKAAAAAAIAVGTAVVGATAKAGTALVNATVDTSKYADEVKTLSSTTGLSTKSLQQMSYASELLDVDVSTMTGSITKMEKTLSTAKGADKFKDLGVSVKDASGQMRSAEDIFWDSIDALGKISNPVERDQKAMELFGKSAKELNPLIEAGSDGFRGFAAEAEKIGYVMDDKTLDAFGDFDDSMQRLSKTAESVKHSFGGVLLPVLSSASGEAVDLLGDFSKALSDAGGDVDKIGGIIEGFAPKAVALVSKYFPQILNIIQLVINALLPALMAIAPQLITTVGSLITQVANSISQNASSFISAFSSLFTSVANSAVTLLPVLIPLAVQLISTLVSALIENAPMLIDGALNLIMTLVQQFTSPESISQLIAGATAIITGLLDGLTTALPILIPAAIDAILTFTETLLSSGCLSQILKAALTLITTLASSLIQYLPKLIERLPEIIMGITKFLTGDALPSIIDAGVTLITAIVKNLPAIIAAIIKALITLIYEMGQYITGDGAKALLKSFGDAFGKIISGAANWGADMIQSFIDGIKKMMGKLGSAVSNVAKTIAGYLHFSVPDMGPLADFDESGGDMILEFIKSMNKEQNALNTALSSTAGAIAMGMDKSYEIAVKDIAASVVGGGAQAAPAGGQWIFPIYIGTEHLDTIIMDSIDRYNYSTGGH